MEEVLDEGAVAGKIVAMATAPVPRKRGVKKGSRRGVRARPLTALNDDEVLLTTEEACIFFGGPSRPIHPATLYRNIGDRYPRPVMIGPNSVRWLRSECRAALQKFIDARGKAA
jgi:predicted DNA-binding transcriptional regulator AlpA